MTTKGRSLGFGASWEVTHGEVWLLFGYAVYFLVHPYADSKKDMWATLESGLHHDYVYTPHVAVSL
jgi:hypothetical protein